MPVLLSWLAAGRTLDEGGGGWVLVGRQGEGCLHGR